MLRVLRLWLVGELATVATRYAHFPANSGRWQTCASRSIQFLVIPLTSSTYTGLVTKTPSAALIFAFTASRSSRQGHFSSPLSKHTRQPRQGLIDWCPR